MNYNSSLYKITEFVFNIQVQLLFIIVYDVVNIHTQYKLKPFKKLNKMKKNIYEYLYVAGILVLVTLNLMLLWKIIA